MHTDIAKKLADKFKWDGKKKKFIIQESKRGTKKQKR